MERYKRNETLGYENLKDIMVYLGYVPGPKLDRTAQALAGKVTYNVMLPTKIATEYAKHTNIIPQEERNSQS